MKELERKIGNYKESIDKHNEMEADIKGEELALEIDEDSNNEHRLFNEHISLGSQDDDRKESN